jgi:hypothetical protein
MRSGRCAELGLRDFPVRTVAGLTEEQRKTKARYLVPLIEEMFWKGTDSLPTTAQLQGGAGLAGRAGRREVRR